MHNRIGFNRLDRKASHRKALHRNMVTSLIKYERITTTKAKAKEIRRTAEKLVTRAKVDSVHNRRIAAKFLFEEAVLHKLFTKVGPRFVKRPGGYTRIFKIGRRSGDAAEMVILEFLKEDEPLIFKKKSSKKGKDFGETGKKAQQGSAADNRQSEQNTDKTTGEPVGEAEENKPEAPSTHGSQMPEADERPTEEASGAEADDDAGSKSR